MPTRERRCKETTMLGTSRLQWLIFSPWRSWCRRP